MSYDYRPLVELRRAGVAEVVAHGAVAWVHGDEPLHEFGSGLVFGRSLVKPFQVRVFSQELAHLTTEQQAIACASHGGTEEHRTIAQSILRADEVAHLLVPASTPLGGTGPATQWTHPCSGKHAAIVRGCLARGWPVERYTAIDHAFHAAYLAELRRVLGDAWQPVATAPDGCGLPTHTFTVVELGRLFASLARDRDWAFRAMTAHPHLVGGAGRLDTDILRAGHGRVVAKEGADGLLALGVVDERWPRGLGIVLKVAHGWDPATMRRVARVLCERLGIAIEDAPAPHGQEAVVVGAVAPGW